MNRLNATEGTVSNPQEVRDGIRANLGSMLARWPCDARLDRVDPEERVLRWGGSVPRDKILGISPYNP